LAPSGSNTREAHPALMQGKPAAGRPRTLPFAMLSRRSHRLTTALFVVLSLLFSQLALASYVCPGPSDTEAMAARMAAGLPCDGMDPVRPALCHQHAADPGQAFEAAKLPIVGQPAIAQVLELPLLLETDLAGAVASTPASVARPPPDPLYLSTLRLRV
jgi:hypothetical protein